VFFLKNGKRGVKKRSKFDQILINSGSKNLHKTMSDLLMSCRVFTVSIYGGYY